MALSGSLTTGYWTADDGRTRGYTLSWTATQSIEYNQSTISWVLSTAGSYPYQVAERTLVVTLAGNTLVNKSNRVMRGAGNVASGSFVVNHDSNGNFSFSGSIQAAVFVSSINCSASGNFSLNTIPRQANITSANNFNDEENPTIGYSNPAGSSVTSLEACISLTGATDDISYRAIPKGENSYTFALTDEERNTLRNATLNGSNSRTVIFYIRTKIGGSTFYDTASRMFTVINANPTVSPIVKDVNQTSLAVTNNENILIKYKSDAQISVGAAAYKGASIVSQKVICGGKSISSGSGVITSVESGNFVFTATDNRGNTVSQTVTKQFIDYIDLTCDLTEVHTSADGKASFKIKGNYYNGAFGAKENYILSDYRYKEEGGEFTKWESGSAVVSGNSYSEQVFLVGLDYKKEYTIEVRVNDLINEKRDSEVVRTIPLFDWGKDDFNFNCSVNVFGKNIFDLIYPVGSIYVSVNDVDPAELFGVGTWVQIKDRFLVSAGDEFEAESTGGKSVYPLRANIGAVDANPGTLGYITTGATGLQQARKATYIISGSFTQSSTYWNHSTPVTDRDVSGEVYDTTILPPYMAVYMWKRIE